jgi:hypothetical protein
MTATHDVDARPELDDDVLWKSLLQLSEEGLPFPTAISAERYSDLGPRLYVQVEQKNFRRYFELIEDPVMRTDDHRKNVHVHAAGWWRDRPLHVVSVMHKGSLCVSCLDELDS